MIGSGARVRTDGALNKADLIGQRNELVFADKPVAAYAEDGHVFGNRQPGGKACA